MSLFKKGKETGDIFIRGRVLKPPSRARHTNKTYFYHLFQIKTSNGGAREAIRKRVNEKIKIVKTHKIIMSKLSKKTKNYCFISSPVNKDTSALKQYIRSYNFETNDSHSIPWEINRDLVSIVEREIKRSNIVVAVLSSTHNNSNVFYEIGFASAQKKPIIIVADEELKIPYFFENLFYIRSDLSDMNKIKFNLDKILISKNFNLIKKDEKRYLRITEIKEKDLSNSLIKNFIEGIKKEIYTEYESIIKIKEIFEHRNIQVQIQHDIRDTGTDLILWVNSLSKIIKGPILVELKQRANNLIIQNSIENLRTELIKSGSSLGIILLLDKNYERTYYYESKYPMILIFSVKELLNKMLIDDFENIILLERNKIAHDFGDY